MKKIDFTQLITKEVLTNDKKHLGHVDGLESVYFIVKDGLFSPRYYKIPREKVDGYQDGKVLLNISEQDTKEQFKRKYPGYFEDVQS
ncbi:MAG: hypothetical protein ACRD8W_28065 [Nitrososphaeraceae archaeon]|jgi:hypothetical protein